MIHRNRHPTGRLGNISFGALQLIDGLVRVMSLGFAHTDLLTTYTRWQTRRCIEVAKAQRQKEATA